MATTVDDPRMLAAISGNAPPLRRAGWPGDPPPTTHRNLQTMLLPRRSCFSRAAPLPVVRAPNPPHPLPRRAHPPPAMAPSRPPPHRAEGASAGRPCHRAVVGKRGRRRGPRARVAEMGNPAEAVDRHVGRGVWCPKSGTLVAAGARDGVFFFSFLVWVAAATDKRGQVKAARTVDFLPLPPHPTVFPAFPPCYPPPPPHQL